LRLQPDDTTDVVSYLRAMELRAASTTFPPPTLGARVTWTPPVPPVRPQAARRSWTAWTLTTVAVIWAAVAVISVFSPDMIHGSEQQHLPVAALATWIWGCAASVAAFVVMTRLRGGLDRRPLWMIVFGATVAMWTAATLISIFGPTVVTGSDPTTIPMAALIAPIVATLATILAAIVVLVTDNASNRER
jgi:hypothetical protein